ncbi:hypothetical protein B0H17DRAFT_1101521 [Mycena rosella]|uniref:Uncharacterized protein n=1 Tax=Mycena rosella TaxID=1033263 RepID=A0AAD7CLN4_MYCRO|nr:hypothetical protein B0H17DRAFT_1101521 [Mycena rosella]
MRLTSALLSLALAGSVAAEPTLQQILGFLNRFQIDFTYPQIIETAQSINYTGFAEDIVGRLDITGTFVGQELNTEYIFGLFAGFATGANVSTPLVGIPLNGTLVDLVIQHNIVTASVIRDFNWTVATVPVRWELKFLIDDEGRAAQYDISLFRSSLVFDAMWSKLAQHLITELGLPADTCETVALQTRAARDICSQHDKYCLGPLQQYNSTEDCMEFVLNTIPMGEVWQGGQNTAFCRYIHTPMLPFRPAVHCPHIGPTGGDMCFDHTYDDMIAGNPFPQSVRSMEHPRDLKLILSFSSALFPAI